MITENSLWGYFTQADAVVKLVMFILLVASVTSWTLIFQRGMLIAKAHKALKTFEEKFWVDLDLNNLYAKLKAHNQALSGLETIFYAGFKEFQRLGQQAGTSAEVIVARAERAMRIAQSREVDGLEQHLSILATIGSVSPYIGLFGTVWGIMTAFHALGNVQQATIAMVAPGISEALIATAMGLFAAIPAVIAYNRYSNEVDRLLNHYETFQEQFSGLLQRQKS